MLLRQWLLERLQRRYLLLVEKFLYRFLCLNTCRKFGPTYFKPKTPQIIIAGSALISFNFCDFRVFLLLDLSHFQ